MKREKNKEKETNRKIEEYVKERVENKERVRKSE